MDKYKFFITTPKGIENILSVELRSFGILDFKETVSGIYVNCSLEEIYRIILFSRVSNNVLVELFEFKFISEDELYKNILSYDWSTVFDVESSFKLETSGKHKKFSNILFLSQKVKDGIVDKFRMLENGQRPNIEKQKADILLNLHFYGENLKVNLSLSGESLHKRGYREEQGIAPLKETLASSILIRSGIYAKILESKKNKKLFELWDGMAGSGTFLIEALMMFFNKAPQLDREYFGFLSWKKHNKNLWENLKLQAKQLFQKNLDEYQDYIKVYASDIDVKSLGIIKQSAKKLNFSRFMKISKHPMETFHNPFQEGKGTIIINPPYGERLNHKEYEKITKIFKNLGDNLKENFKESSLCVFTSTKDLLKSLGIRTIKENKFFNGTIETSLFKFEINEEYFMKYETKNEKFQRKVDLCLQNMSHRMEGFINKLNKNVKKLKSWKEKNNIEAYRLYDKELPEYNIIVDIYKDKIHIQEYKAPNNIPEKDVTARFFEALACIHKALGVSPQKFFVKMREKQKGTNQYEKQDNLKNKFLIKENDIKVFVNLTDYLDTGLFFDNRKLRFYFANLLESYKNKNVLNLFSYTCTASIIPALKGANTINVDLSNTYLDWGRENYYANKLKLDNHRFIKQDCEKFLLENNIKFDLIFLDPPSFSNSKKMDKILDIEKDHKDLINLSMANLSKTGFLVFCTNLKNFNLDASLYENFEIKDLNPLCVDKDFINNKNKQYRYLINFKKQI